MRKADHVDWRTVKLDPDQMTSAQRRNFDTFIDGCLDLARRYGGPRPLESTTITPAQTIGPVPVA